MEKKTALYEEHLAAKGKLVPFAGYLLPIEYESGVLAEHAAVRAACGLFDVSHMGEILISGKGALDALNNLMTNEFSSLAIGRCRYSLMCNEQGGTVDDVIVSRLDEEAYLVVVNAANKDKDFAWMREHLGKEAGIEDQSEAFGQLALQGPRAAEVLAQLTEPDGLPARSFSFQNQVDVAGVECLVSRSGYTGEDGFELYCAAEKSVQLWNAILLAAQAFGGLPCGLGARDTLRFEAGLPLYGHELDERTTPLEAGLAFAVKLDKPFFIGKEALEKDAGPRMRIGLEVTGRGIVRDKAPLFSQGRLIGKSASGMYCPTLRKACASALVAKESVALGEEVICEVRGRDVAARVVNLPFYRSTQRS